MPDVQIAVTEYYLSIICSEQLFVDCVMEETAAKLWQLTNSLEILVTTPTNISRYSNYIHYMTNCATCVFHEKDKRMENAWFFPYYN